MSVPSKQVLKRFLEVFDKLCAFEAETRMVRGYGVFTEEEIPIPEVVTVRQWLEKEGKDD